MQEEFALTSEEKSRIINELMEEIQGRSGIMAIRSDDILQGRLVSSTVHSYQVAGSEMHRKTQNTTLQQRALEAQVSAQKQSLERAERAEKAERAEEVE
jgi:hypothetical protein